MCVYGVSPITENRNVKRQQAAIDSGRDADSESERGGGDGGGWGGRRTDLKPEYWKHQNTHRLINPRIILVWRGCRSAGRYGDVDTCSSYCPAK